MKKLVQLHPADNVAVVIVDLGPGEVAKVGGLELRAITAIAAGHKMALRTILGGEKVRRNNMAIGSATQEILAGDHVHLHNLKSDYIATLPSQ